MDGFSHQRWPRWRAALNDAESSTTSAIPRRHRRVTALTHVGYRRAAAARRSSGRVAIIEQVSAEFPMTIATPAVSSSACASTRASRVRAGGRLRRPLNDRDEDAKGAARARQRDRGVGLVDKEHAQPRRFVTTGVGGASCCARSSSIRVSSTCFCRPLVRHDAHAAVQARRSGFASP